jgi:PleD family two-component response regulator
VQDLDFPLEYSAGLAAMGQQDRTLDSLLRRADEALYEAKRAGRGQVVLAPRAVSTPAQEPAPV